MKFALSLVSILTFGVSAQAAINTCADLKAAYEADLITEISVECNGNQSCDKIQAAQLRETAIERAGDYDPSQTDEDLQSELDPIFTKLQIGSEVYDGVNVSLGDNPFVSYFALGTTTRAPISSDDGSISVAGQYCDDVELGPYFSPARREILCQAVVTEVKKQKPASTLDLAACLDDTASDFMLETDDGRADVLGLYVSRNTQNFGGGYFTCTAEMDRATNALSNLQCSVK